MQKLFFCAIYLIVSIKTGSQPTDKALIHSEVTMGTVVDTHSKKNRLLQYDNEIGQGQILSSRDQSVNITKQISRQGSYPITIIDPIHHSNEMIHLSSIGRIKMIDARFDTKKIGFMPVSYELSRKGYATIGLQLKNNVAGWLNDHFFERNIQLENNSNHMLVIVLQKFWFSNSVNDYISYSNPKLLTTLNYHFDVYTSTDSGYYPQKKILGNFTTLYNNGMAYNHLTDSLLNLLKKVFLSIKIKEKEIAANWLSTVNFIDYYNKRLMKTLHNGQIPNGIYVSYADFLEKKVSSDHVEMILKYTNNNPKISPYACQLLAFKEGAHVPINHSWGYFDGNFLYLNIGNGFFVKLLSTENGYVFFFLQNIYQDKIKKSIRESIQIGASPYRILKNYLSLFKLTYQLDPETGILY